MVAARRCFTAALDGAGRAPDRVTTDGHDASARASRAASGDAVAHRTGRCKHNRSEQGHRGVKQRSYPRRGFGPVAGAARSCPAFAGQRRYFRAVCRSGEAVSLADRRRVFPERWPAVRTEMIAA